MSNDWRDLDDDVEYELTWESYGRYVVTGADLKSIAGQCLEAGDGYMTLERVFANEPDLVERFHEEDGSSVDGPAWARRPVGGLDEDGNPA